MKARRSVLAVGALVGVVGAGACTAGSGTVSAGGGLPLHTEAGPASPTPASVAPTGEGSARTLYLWEPITGEVRVVGSLPLSAADAELSPRQDPVVYERKEAGPGGELRSQIFFRWNDGVERQLTHVVGGASDPTWSPDGSAIAFAARPHAHARADTDIFVANAHGRHLRIRRLAGTPRDDIDPDWSPDGSRIAFQSRAAGGRGGIWVASIEERTVSRLTPNLGIGARDPAWSPDGRWIAYSRYSPGFTLNGELLGSELWLIRADGTVEQRVLRGNKVNENPSWSPDGRLIVFEQHEWDGGHNRVLMIDRKTGRARSILARRSIEPSWSDLGILMNLEDEDPAPRSRSVASFGIEVPGIAATVSIRKREGCELNRYGTTHPDQLRLQLVNDSHLEGGFWIRRLSTSRTLGYLRTHPVGFRFIGLRTLFLDRSTSRVWSSTGRFDSGRWAVVCYEDTNRSLNGFSFVPVGVVGPIDVGR